MSLHYPWYDSFYEMPHPRGQSRLPDFSIGLMVPPEEFPGATPMGRPQPRSVPCFRDYYRPWHTLNRQTARLDSGASVVRDKDKLQVCLDVQQFAPTEITVKTIGKQIVVEGKHEERPDEHGFISRHFVRKYNLPKHHKPDDVVSTLSLDGVLTITAPKKPVEVDMAGERLVPIQTTGPSDKVLPKNETPTAHTAKG